MMLAAGMQGFVTCLLAKTRQKKLLRDIRLKLADTLRRQTPAQLRRAMGLNDLPQWLR